MKSKQTVLLWMCCIGLATLFFIIFQTPSVIPGSDEPVPGVNEQKETLFTKIVPTEFPSLAAREQMFDELVTATRANHEFTEQIEINLNEPWEDLLPLLREEFRAADTPTNLSVGLAHFTNSLRNPHCSYNSPDRPVYLTLGIEIKAEPEGANFKFYISEPGDLKNLIAGDLIVSLDGIPAEQFLKNFRFESNSNNPLGRAMDIAKFLTNRKTNYSLKKEGDKSRLIVRRRNSQETTEAEVVWKKVLKNSRNDFAVDYGQSECVPGEIYGPYKLHTMGTSYCVYASDQLPYSEFPVVRQFTFMYSGRNAQQALVSDHFNLKAALSHIPEARGIILDLRENQGGNNPNWFLNWWAPGTYKDHLVYMGIRRDLNSMRSLKDAKITGWGNEEITDYLQQIKNVSEEQDYLPPRPFFCPDSGCEWDNQYTPSEQVTNLPIILLVGPKCMSSCDHVASVFRENDFGLLIGQPTAAGYTTYRMRHHISAPDGSSWGFLRFALSYEVSGKTGKTVEAVPVEVDYRIDRTFKNHSHYDRLLVDQAIKAQSEQRQ